MLKILSRRIRTLESRWVDREAPGLTPFSEGWFDHWKAKVYQYMAGDMTVDLTRCRIEIIRAVIAEGQPDPQ
jgi:hypothetical protein